MKLTEKQIKEIAEDLECGMRCFYNLKTQEIKAILDFDSGFYDDEEFVQKEAEEFKQNSEDYFEFTKLNSNESYQIMTDFSESVDNYDLQDKLIRALNKPKPFRNFKRLIDSSGEYRELWFEFKQKRYIEYLKQQMECIS